MLGRHLCRLCDSMKCPPLKRFFKTGDVFFELKRKAAVAVPRCFSFWKLGCFAGRFLFDPFDLKGFLSSSSSL